MRAGGSATGSEAGRMAFSGAAPNERPEAVNITLHMTALFAYSFTICCKTFHLMRPLEKRRTGPVFELARPGPAQVMTPWLCFFRHVFQARPTTLPRGHPIYSVCSCTLHTSHAAPIRVTHRGRSLELSFAIQTPGQLPDSAVQSTNQCTAPNGKRREGNDRIAPSITGNSCQGRPGTRGREWRDQHGSTQTGLNQEDS